jgi:4-amino-4-deoxy-L-arabinose transferase-like glycosyltransferase
MANAALREGEPSGPLAQPTLLRALLFAAPFLALALLTKLPSLAFEHREPDEVIYWTVAKRMSDYGTYSLRGAPFMHQLSRKMYDRPLFHHPPLYPALLVPFEERELRREAIVISWLGHGLAIFAVALIGVHLHARLGGDTSAWAALALPLLGVALDPLFVHTARKLWIDALVGGLAALAVALTLAGVARERRRAPWLLAAGVALGLAGLAKLPGLLVAPVCAALVLARSARARERVAGIAWIALPSALILAPWFAVFFATYGTLVPSWMAPDATILERFPLVAAAAQKPWHFFATKLALIQPLLLVALAGFAWRAGERRPSEAWVLLTWLIGAGACLTYLAASGFSFQTRYLTPLTPALYALPLALPAWYRAPTVRSFRLAAALAITYATLGAAPYLTNGRPDEFLSLAETLGLITL